MTVAGEGEEGRALEGGAQVGLDGNAVGGEVTGDGFNVADDGGGGLGEELGFGDGGAEVVFKRQAMRREMPDDAHDPFAEVKKTGVGDQPPAGVKYDGAVHQFGGGGGNVGFGQR